MRVDVARGAQPGPGRGARGEQRIGGQPVVHRVRVGVQVEQGAQPVHRRGEVAQVGEGEPAVQPAAGRTVGRGEPVDLGDAVPERQGQGPPVRAGPGPVPRDHLLDAGDGAQREEVQQVLGVDGAPVGQPQPEPAGRGGGAAVAAVLGAQRARGAVVDLADGVVELPHRGEAGRERHVGDREFGGLEEQSGGLRALRAGQRERACAELGGQLPLELAGTVAEPVGEPRDAFAVDHAVTDQPDRPADQVGAVVPLGRARHRVGPAAAAGPVAGALGGGRGRVEAAVGALGGGGRAARTAVDAGGADGREEHPVEAGVPAVHGSVPGLVVDHAIQSAPSPDPRLAGIGHRRGRGRAGAGRCRAGPRAGSRDGILSAPGRTAGSACRDGVLSVPGRCRRGSGRGGRGRGGRP